MADIFISYKSERRKAADHFAHILSCYGYSVWFDYFLAAGKDFGFRIDAELHEAKAAIVLWCTKSVASHWVAEEVGIADKLGTLVPVMIEDCKLPAGFTRLDYINLIGWDGSPRDHKLDRLWDTLEQKTGQAPNLNLKEVRKFEETWRRYGAQSLKTFALGDPLEVSESNRKLPGVETPRSLPALSQLERDWTRVENSADPRDFRDFIEEHKAGFLVRRAQRELAELAETAWSAAQQSRDVSGLERFLKLHFDSDHAETARATLERLARAKKDDRYRAEGRIKLDPAIVHGAPDGWFLPGAGKTEWFQDFAGGPEMVVVPAGRFTMGSPDTEPERSSDEGPQHEVTIAAPFAAGRSTVTRGQFSAFVSATGHKTDGGAHVWNGKEWKLDPKKSWRDPSFAQDDTHPVVCVNWHDATAYIDWLNGRVAGKHYRLLSEAEWEYVCRAKTETPFWWGSSITPEQANYDGNTTYAGGGSKGRFLQKTLPVNSFEANRWGLYQVHGNVWEWCADCWNGSYKGAPADGSAWTTGDCANRVLRGGSWFNYPREIRSAFRSRGAPVNRSSNLGFRLARTLLTP